MIPRILSTENLTQREAIIYSGYCNKLLLPEINEKLIESGTDPISEREYKSRVQNYEVMSKSTAPNQYKSKLIF